MIFITGLNSKHTIYDFNYNNLLQSNNLKKHIITFK